MPSSSGYGHAEREQPDKGAQTGDHRGDEVAQHVAAHLGQDLIADQDGPRPPRVRHQLVGEHLDPGQAGQEVDAEHHDRQDGGHGADHQGPGAEDPADQGAAPAGDQRRQALLDVVLDVELAQLRIAVLQVVHVVRNLVGQRGGLGSQRRDRRREKRRHDAHRAADDGEHGGPPGYPVPDQPADDRIQAHRDEQRQADDDEHGPRPDEQLDQAVGDRHAEGAGQPDHERRSFVDGPPGRSEATRLLGDLGRRLQSLLDPPISPVPLWPGFLFLGTDFLLRPDLRRLGCMWRTAHSACASKGLPPADAVGRPRTTRD